MADLQATKKRQRKSGAWSGIRTLLEAQNSRQLTKLIGDLYDLNKANRDFLNARFTTGEQRLAPYKKIIDQALYPDVYHDNQLSIMTGRNAISAYKQATGDDDGVLELMVYFVERGNQFTVDFGDIDETFYASLESMFDRVIKVMKRRPEVVPRFLPRLVAVRDAAEGIGWGYYDYLCEALATLPETA